MERRSLHARVWRWHFFAGLFVAPFAIVLALSGAVYLFKPQIESAVERRIERWASGGPPLPADELVAAALARVEGARLQKYVLPEAGAHTAQIQVALAGGAAQLLRVDRANGQILEQTPPDAQLMRIVHRLHGELLGGPLGSALVELAACWMILLILSGLYLAWPRSRSWRRVLLPGLSATSRRGLRELHAAAGIWLSGFVLLLLFSGLPWTGVWGGAFTRLKDLAGAAGLREEWSPGAGRHDGLHAWSPSADEGQVAVRSVSRRPAAQPVALQEIAELAARERLAAPVEISPPRDENGVWTVRSMTQRRPDRMTIHYDRFSAEELMRIGFADRSAVERLVSYGIALHEGQLFGPLNQALGVAIALGVIAISASGVAMWWRRRPQGALGVPPLPSERRIARGVTVLVLGLGAFFPLVGASLIAVALGEALWARWAVAAVRTDRGAG